VVKTETANGKTQKSRRYRTTPLRVRSRQQPTMDALPDELLAYVLSLVASQTLVCAVPSVSRRWRDTCRLRVAVALDLRWAYRPPQGGAGCFPMMMMAPRVTDRARLNSNPVTDAAVRVICNRFAAVGAAQLERCSRLSEAGLEAILTLGGGGRLTSLGLAHCVRGPPLQERGEARRRTDAVLGLIGRCCPNLVVLDLTGWKLVGIDHAGLASIGAGCRSLRTSTSTSFWTVFSRISRAAHQPTRAVCYDLRVPPLIADWCLQSDVVINLGLTGAVDLSGCRALQDKSLELLSGCRLLQKLDLSCEGDHHSCNYRTPRAKTGWPASKLGSRRGGRSPWRGSCSPPEIPV